MLGLPCTDWTEAEPAPAPPLAADWTRAPTGVRHTFTHFHLALDIEVAQVRADIPPRRGAFQPAGEALIAALPTVMRKAARAGLSALA